MEYLVCSSGSHCNMVLRKFVLMSLLAVVSGRLTNADAPCERLCGFKQQKCPSPCAPCPSASCPVPVCPPQPPVHCPPLPEIPTCPTPLVNLTCPACPACPACPPALKCPPSPAASIPRDYTTIPDLGSYKFFREKRTWTDAHVICSRDGGHLAIPNTKEEFSHLTKMMDIHDVRIVHAGFHRVGDTASFITTLGQPLDSVQLSFWKNASTDVSKKCVYIGIGSKATFTEQCSDNEYFICEI